MITNSLGFELDIFGLKPNTLHKVYVDGVDCTANSILRDVNVADSSTTWIESYTPGSYLPSDGFGQMKLLVFKDESASTSSLKEENRLLSNMKAITTILVCSSDVTPIDIIANNDAYKNARSASVSSISIKSTDQPKINTSDIQIPFSSTSLRVGI